MKLAQTILFLNPELDPIKDFRVKVEADPDTGELKETLEHWDEEKLGPRPDLIEIAKSEAQAVAAAESKASGEQAYAALVKELRSSPEKVAKLRAFLEK